MSLLVVNAYPRLDGTLRLSVRMWSMPVDNVSRWEVRHDTGRLRTATSRGDVLRLVADALHAQADIMDAERE